MPTAIPVAPSRPDTAVSAGRHRELRPGPIFRFALCLTVIWTAGALQPATSVAAQGAPAAVCAGWSSLDTPPDTIRVLRRKSGRIETVPFRDYVVTVMGKEWPSYLPQSLVEAGAVAVKQYAWYHTVYSSRDADGRCYDVRDGVSDQLYKPGRARISSDHYVAADATWNVTIHKDGQFIMTGYRRGDKVRCGRDATGYKLFAMSAMDCARKGDGWREILRTYYGQGITLVGDDVPSPGADPGVVPPDTSTAPVTATPPVPAPPAGSAAGDVDPVTASEPSQPGGIGGAQTGGLGASVAEHEQRLMLLWLASNSLV